MVDYFRRAFPESTGDLLLNQGFDFFPADFGENKQYLVE